MRLLIEEIKENGESKVEIHVLDGEASPEELLVFMLNVTDYFSLEKFDIPLMQFIKRKIEL